MSFPPDSPSVIYSVFDRQHYLNIKNYAKRNFLSLGKDDVKGDTFKKGSMLYAFRVDIFNTDCGDVNRYIIWMYRE